MNIFPVPVECKECPLNIEESNRNELLALIAHELRNPLTAVVMATQILKRSSINDPGIKQAVKTIDRQTNQLIHLVDSLTDVSRLKTNKIKLQMQPVQLHNVCESAVESVKSIIDSKHHRLNVQCEHVEIRGDASRLQQVISNLLSNAAKFTHNGGEISLHIVKTGEKHVTLTVQDNGIGIEPEALEKVTQIFFQERRNGQDMFGLGMGLTLAKNLVERHGGTLSITSNGKDTGTKVVVILPIEGRDLSREEEGIRVLIIDDNMDNANTLGVLLEMENYQCRCVYDGPTGLTEIAGFKPHVVFLDIGMPEMDGYEVISKIPAENRPFIVAVTGFCQPGDKIKTKMAGFDIHIVKPPKPEEIIGILQAVEEIVQK